MVLSLKSMQLLQPQSFLTLIVTLIFVNAVPSLVSAFDLVFVFANLDVAKLIELSYLLGELQ